MSTLVSDEALENFAEAEELLCSNEDALFSIDDGKVSAFISYVWLVLSVEGTSDLNQLPSTSRELLTPPLRLFSPCAVNVHAYQLQLLSSGRIFVATLLRAADGLVQVHL